MVSTRSASAALATPRRTSPSSSAVTPLPSPSKPRAPRSSTTPSGIWTHTPTPLTLLWLALSIPLVTWDMLYVFLRPHSMPGGKWHWPIWSPYAIQAELDYTYGFKEWNAGGGWNTAQSVVNVVESLMYLGYLGLWYRNRNQGGKGELKGRTAAVGVLVLYTAVVTTVGKTVLYWLNEAFSGFANIGHNDLPHMVLWVVTNGAWIVFPAIIAYTTGAEILNGLTKASGGPRKSE